jgi:hypothetical protein
MAVPVVAGVGALATGGDGDGSVTITLETNIVSGDGIVLVCQNDNDSTPDTYNAVTGYELVNEAGNSTSDAHVVSYVRRADGTEGTTIDVTYTTQAQTSGMGKSFRITGVLDTSAVDTPDFLDVTGADTIDNAGDLTITEITTATADSLVLGVAAHDGKDGDPATISGTGWTLTDSDKDGTGGGAGGGCSGVTCEKDQASAAATGSPVVAWGASDGSAGFLFAIASSSGADHTLLADDVQSLSQVTTPAIGQSHVLLADDVQSLSQVTAPAVGQEHALLAEDVQSLSQVTAPVITSASFGDLVKTDLTTGTTNTSTGDLGSNPKSGNLLIVGFGHSSSGTGFTTPPSGFTELYKNNSGSGAAWWWGYKISVGTEQTVSMVWSASGNQSARYNEYEWDGSTPSAVNKNQDTTWISTATNSMKSGAVTPSGSTNIVIAGHSTDDALNSFSGQAIDGTWIEDNQFTEVTFSEFKFSRKVNATGSQEATHSDTDVGDQMLGVIAAFIIGGSEHTLLADDVQSLSQVTTPAVGQEHALLADDVQSLSQVDTPVVGQEHALLANDIESASEVTTPAASESHILLADDVESASEVTSPIIGQSHVLDATDIDSLSQVDAPAIGQEHSILADDADSASEVDTPAVGQEHGLFADDVQSLSELTTPSVSESNILLADDVESASEVTVPVVSQIHAIAVVSVESLSQVDTPSVGQEHAILADDVQSLSEVTNPVLAEEGTHVLLADDVESSSELTIPVVGQSHILLSVSTESNSEVSTPNLSELYALLANDVESASEVTTPSIGSEHILLSNDAESLSELSNPVIAQTHSLLSVSVQSLSQVSIPILVENGLFEWEEQCPDDSIWAEQSDSSGSWQQQANDNSIWVKETPSTINTKRCA